MRHLRLIIILVMLVTAFSSIQAQDEEIVITQWYHQYGEEGTFEAVQRYAAEYSEMTDGVTVEVVWIPGDYGTRLNSALLADEGPDVFEINFPPIQMVQAGQLAPLTDMYSDEVLEDFSQATIDRVTVDGEIYGIPMIVDIFYMFYYRISAFEAAGIEEPQTFAELLAAAEAVNDGRVKGIFLGNGGGLSYHVSHNLTYSAGSSAMDGDTVELANDLNAELWESMLELSRSDALLDGAATNWWDSSTFNNGLANIQMSGLWAMPGILDTWGDDVGVFPWPAFDEDGEPKVVVNGWWQVVNAASPNLDAARDYAAWLWIENQEIQRDWALSYGFHIPPRLSVAEDATQLQDGIAAEALSFFADYGYDSFPAGWTQEMQTILQDAFAATLFDDTDPLEALASAESQIQDAYNDLYDLE